MPIADELLNLFGSGHLKGTLLMTSVNELHQSARQPVTGALQNRRGELHFSQSGCNFHPRAMVSVQGSLNRAGRAFEVANDDNESSNLDDCGIEEAEETWVRMLPPE